jgi:DNA repair exonuclease SbcCD ATPase subunit
MSRDIFVETLPNGQQQFVRLKRSRSHHHHPHLDFHLGLGHHHHDGQHNGQHNGHHKHHRRRKSHHHHHDDCACVTIPQWNALVEHERQTHAENEGLRRENKSLKDDLAASTATNAALKADIASANGEIRRLEGCVTDLNARTQTLIEDNAALRTSLDSATDQLEKRSCELDRKDREVEKLRRRVARLEDANDELAARNRQLEREHSHHHPHPHDYCPSDGLVAELRRAVSAWRAKFEQANENINRLYDCIDQQRDKITLYERLLRRHHIIFS